MHSHRRNSQELKSSPRVWGTPNGDLESTPKKCESQFTSPELHDDRLIEWDFQITKKLGVDDVIIGRGLLEFLGMDIHFSDNVIAWDGATVPFRHTHTDGGDSFHVDDPEAVIDTSERIKKMLDAKHVPANLEEVCSEQDQLSRPDEQQQLSLALLRKHE